MNQVRLAQTDAAIKKQRVISPSRSFSNLQGSRPCKVIGFAGDKGPEGQIGVESSSFCSGRLGGLQVGKTLILGVDLRIAHGSVMQVCLSSLMGTLLNTLRSRLFCTPGNFEAHPCFGADELCCQLGDPITVLRSNPIEFDAIGRTQGQKLIAFVIAQENQRFDPGAKQLGWQFGFEVGRAGKPEVVHWRAR
jgi:hypothetical protein